MYMQPGVCRLCSDCGGSECKLAVQNVKGVRAGIAMLRVMVHCVTMLFARAWPAKCHTCQSYLRNTCLRVSAPVELKFAGGDDKT